MPVRDVTGLNEGADVSEARIVDRTAWVRAATESMRVMTGGSENGDKPNFVTGRITGAQTGAVLAFISSGILGQYDPFAENGGELLLVYPNVIAVERQLRVLPADFRLWVCLHEVTHRVQFRANPWLADHMSNALAVLTEETGDDVTEVDRPARRTSSADRRDGVERRTEFERCHRPAAGRPVRAAAQALDQLLVLGTLLEGHADHVMDAVGPAVVPSVVTIRRRFDERRNRKQSPLQRVVRALLGYRRQDEPVHPRQGVRRPRRRPGRDGTVQHHLDRARKHCRCQRKSTTRSDGSTGFSKRVADRGRRVRPSSRRRGRALVCRAVGRPGLAGADRRRREAASRPPR